MAIRFDVVTLFPEMFAGPLDRSIIGRAQEAGLVEIKIHSLRDWSDDPRHQKVDDRPFGGGAGMVIKAEPVYRAIKDLGGMKKKDKPWVVLLSPQGKLFSQTQAHVYSRKRRIVFICGHYEGFDERVMEWVDEEMSIGDYVLTGGEIPAMVVIDAVTRLVPGVVGDPASVANESFSNGLLDYPHYTRPPEWRGRPVPPVLLSGNHAKIADWRKKEALRQTKKKRPKIFKTLSIRG